MAKARMLHKSISTSSQVNKLSLPSRLLFTWMISHADDEGKLKGEPEYVKATVVPMTRWTFGKIRTYIDEIKNVGLIYHWSENDEQFIEFVKWNDHQTIQKDRFKPSKLPSFDNNIVNKLETKRSQSVNEIRPQYNISEVNERKENISETNDFAFEDSFKKSSSSYPDGFRPATEGESAACDAWEQLECENPGAFKSTYLKALKQGLPTNLFFEFTSEIKQDETIQNPGAVFNKKVDEYFGGKA